MLNFGKYKGKTLLQVFNYDIPYAIWMINSIPYINSKLDKEDNDTLFKYAFPYDYISKKYGYNLHSHKHINEAEIIDILKKEGFVECAYSYIDNSHISGVEAVVKTFYGSTFGGAFGCGDCDVMHYDLLNTICQHLNKAEEWFKNYIKHKKNLSDDS